MPKSNSVSSTTHLSKLGGQTRPSEDSLVTVIHTESEQATVVSDVQSKQQAQLDGGSGPAREVTTQTEEQAKAGKKEKTTAAVSDTAKVLKEKARVVKEERQAEQAERAKLEAGGRSGLTLGRSEDS